VRGVEVDNDTKPPDPIKKVCSLTGKSIADKYVTYCSVQISKMLFRRFYSPESDPPHKILRYWFCYSTQFAFLFPPDQNGRVEMFCTIEVPAPKGHLGGTSPSIFLHDS